MNIKSVFASSVDPTKISLTIESVAKFVIYAITAVALAKGLDPMQATTGVEQVRDILISIVPACFAVVHGCLAVYGVIRKFAVDNSSVQN